MTVDNTGNRLNYVWHDMPEEVRRDLERRRSGGKNPKEERKQNKRDTNGYAEKGANVPPARNDPPENEIIPKVNKTQQTAEEEYPTEERVPQKQVEEKKDQPKEEEVPQKQVEEKKDQPKEEEVPQKQVEGETEEQPEGAQEAPPQAGNSEDVEVQQPQTVGGAKNAKTKHTIRFRGSKWEGVLKNRQSELETAFKKDVTEGSGLPERRISGLKFEFNDVLIATFTVRHENDEEMMKEVHAKLEAYNFPNTTALYKVGQSKGPGDSQCVEVQQPQTVGGARNAGTKHTIRFRGSKWENVLKNRQSELETALKKDVTEGFDLPERRISGLKFVFNDVLIATFTVRHENDEEMMKQLHEKLQSYNFPNTIALYDMDAPNGAGNSQDVEVQRPQTVGGAKNARTKHTIYFRGSKWEDVLNNRQSELEAAFKKDVTEGSGLPERRISGLKFEFNDLLIATFAVRHENDEGVMKQVHAKLQAFNFPNTTALYDS
ncbi:putative mitotubule-associated protein Gb4 [Trypanosoma theileri]|uniref:Putative mitotubule-associated protein Gb4 n=1 Tax=Trypanosoma theileri TaxID=67003 RepID=A0A1X0P7K6_9TRYP|nr:putative mitotubule-associated protein Gb4 [Trypanosoma theileri]ORC92858.1 putative mitotubule-associated protein Gb4 [Trypanosoma theileri]